MSEARTVTLKPRRTAILGALLTLAAVGASATAGAATTLTYQDMLWLDRVTYGPTTAAVDQYLKLGRRRFL
jgi:hypothetical protein